jgi:hypothetical protein
MNILKGVAETLLGKDNESYEQKKEKFERLEHSENKEVLTKEPVQKETRLKEEVIQHVIQPTQKTEVLPVVNLEREQTEIHEVIQPIKQKEVLPTTVEEKQLPTIEKEEVRESDAQFRKEYEEMSSKMKPSTHLAQVKKEKEVKKAVVHETVHKKVIEEIQPVIHKETIAPHLIKETQPIKERLVEAPVLVKEQYDTKTDLEELKKQGVKVESYTHKAITEETVRPIERREVQPVVNLEREQTEVHEVIQPISQKEVLPTTVEERQLPTIEKEARESEEGFKKQYEQLTNQFKSKVDVQDVQQSRVLNAPIVHETVHKTIIEEIQPVIHKETIVPHLVKEHFTIHEKLVEAPVLTTEVLPEKDLGTTYIAEGAAPVDRSALKHKKLA